MTLKYDAGDRITKVTDTQAPGDLSMVYDGLDRVTQETTRQSTVSRIFDAGGRPTSVTVSGQTATGYSFDAANHLTQITQGAATVSIVPDPAGRTSSASLPNGVVKSLSYDQASQLTGITFSQGLGSIGYTYDATGRRATESSSFGSVTIPVNAGPRTYDAANELVKDGSTTIAYTADGEQQNDATHTFTWDARHRLVGVDSPSSGTFVYDALVSAPK